MFEIERWSIDRLSESFAKTHAASGSRGLIRARKGKWKSRLAAPARAIIARAIRHFSGWRKRHAPLAKAG